MNGERRGQRGWLATLAGHPATPVVLVVGLVVWKLRAIGLYFDLPNNDQVAYLDWGRRWRLDAKAPLYVAYLGSLGRVAGVDMARLFLLEKVTTTAFFCGALYLALRPRVPALAATIVSLHFLGLWYVLEETNDSHLFAMSWVLLAMALVGWWGRRGAPAALAALVLAALARTELWLVVGGAAPVLLLWYARGAAAGPRRREALAWAPALLGALLAVGLWRSRAGDTIPLGVAFRHMLVVALLERLSGFLPILAKYDGWVDAQFLAPQLFRADVGALDIVRAYPQVVAMHVAANLVELPRTVLAIMIKHASARHFLTLWGLAVAALAVAGRGARRAGGPGEAWPAASGARRVSAYLAGLGLLPVLFMLVFLKTTVRYVFALLPLQALIVAALTGILGRALARAAGPGAGRSASRRPASGAETLALWALVAVYAALPLGPLSGLRAGPLPRRALVASLGPAIPDGSVLASDLGGFVCVFGPRCRSERLNSQSLADASAWEALGAQRVFLSDKGLRRVEGPTPADRPPPGWAVLLRDRSGVLLGREGT